ncbi:hypothetical protein VP01_504g4 [Puccinia sorghi]|uniref:Tet-like 2OG-Fe(II) oxygenase domain-containing protein n=1 Tax=Puccinia sorghi TaxID=27349 RepID=A0A0L6ULJ1_9BASI|nr:hypothetical protein VP01_504g4 [Puccinia sorghi]
MLFTFHTMDSTFLLLHSGRCVTNDPKNNTDHRGQEKLKILIHFPPLFIKRHNNCFKLWECISNNSRLINKKCMENCEEIALVPFHQNKYLMEKLNISSFSSFRHGKKPSPTTFSSHLTFTTKGFFNPPRIDKADDADYAFFLFLPTFSDTGALAPPDSNSEVCSGLCIFPDYKIVFNFDHHHDVKIIWQASKYKYCTLPSSPSSKFTLLGISLQINLSLANASHKHQIGDYKNPLSYFGDHFYYMFRSLGKGTLLAIIFFFNFLLHFLFFLS